ncbi:MAG: phosphatase PAP2 family protein [Anaerolineales bacterium]|nr:phosphatase PAP2 family protein [Anaerolineales bacterium]
MHIWRKIFLTGLVFLLVACQTSAPPSPTVAPSPTPPTLIAASELGLLGVTADTTMEVPANLPVTEAEYVEQRALTAQVTSAQRETITYWNREAVLHWNEIARTLTAENDRDALTASRLYAVLSLAQFNALQAARTLQPRFQRGTPYPSESAALAAASATVLTHFFPGNTALIEKQRAAHQESRLWAGLNVRGDIMAGDGLGRALAGALITQSEVTLTPAMMWEYSVPTGPGMWVPDVSNPYDPLFPNWRNLKPWFLASADQFRAPPPPAFESPEFAAALAEVRQISDTRTEEQLRVAKFWADARFSITPPGHWNAIAAELLAGERDEVKTARILAYVNMALMDAGIAAWDTKYTYWLIRPFNADVDIKTPLLRPNHPSYVSGHSAFSAAAAEVLSAAFPAKREALWAIAQEASVSRVYAGIHYRFDCEAGLVLGQAVGQLAAAELARTP